MRIRHVILGGLAIGFATMAACSRTEPEPGALMLAVQTDMRAPDDVDAIGIYVTINGEVIFAVEAEVPPNGVVKLPATLAIVGKKRPGAVAKIRVAGFQKGRARVVRDAVASIPLSRTALLRIPLRWVDDGQAVGKQGDANPFADIRSTCAGEQTPIDGECSPANVDSTTLLDYSDAEVFGGGSADGTGGTCIDVAACFDKSIDVPDLALDTCTFPAPASATFTVGIHVQPSTGGTCASAGCYVPLDADADDGWRREGSVIKVARGVCRAIKAGRALGVAVSTCAPKPASQPLCGPASAVTGGVPGTPIRDGGGASAAVEVGRTNPPAALVDVALSDTDVFALASDGKVFRTSKTLSSPPAPFLMAFDSGPVFLTDGGPQSGDFRFGVARDGSMAITQRGSRQIVIAKGNGLVFTHVSALSAAQLPFRITALTVDESTPGGAAVWTEVPTPGDNQASFVYSCPMTTQCSGLRSTKHIEPFSPTAPHPIEIGYAPFDQTSFAAYDDGVIREARAGGVVTSNSNGSFPIASPVADEAALYWMASTDASVTDTIFQAGISIGSATPFLGGQSFRGPNARQDIAVDTLYPDAGSSFTGDSYLFWTNSAGEVRARRTNVADKTELVIATEPGTRGLAIDRTHVYWSRIDGAVRRFARADLAALKK